MSFKTYVWSGLLLSVGVILFLLANSENTLTGLFSFVEIAPEGFVFTPPAEVSEELARKALQDAEWEIAQMRQRNFSITFVADVFNEATIQQQRGNYTEVLRMAQLISFINKKKGEFLDKVELTKRKEQEYQNMNIAIGEAQALVEQAVSAFYQDQLVDAQALLQQADAELEKARAEKERQRSLAYLGKSFFLKYWWQLLVALIALGVISVLATIKSVRRKRQRALRALQDELANTPELIRRLQKACFIDKSITTNSYKQKAAKYEERIAEIKHTIPFLEAQLGKKTAHEQNRAILEVKR